MSPMGGVEMRYRGMGCFSNFLLRVGLVFPPPVRSLDGEPSNKRGSYVFWIRYVLVLLWDPQIREARTIPGPAARYPSNKSGSYVFWDPTRCGAPLGSSSKRGSYNSRHASWIRKTRKRCNTRRFFLSPETSLIRSQTLKESV